MIKADELNQWVKKAKEYCYGKRCYKCELRTDGPVGAVCSFVDGSTTQEQVDLIYAFEPPVDWSRVPIDTKINVWENPERKYKRYFAKYENGKIYVFNNGSTSWSHANNGLTEWTHGELAKEDDE